MEKEKKHFCFHLEQLFDKKKGQRINRIALTDSTQSKVNGVKHKLSGIMRRASSVSGEKLIKCDDVDGNFVLTLFLFSAGRGWILYFVGITIRLVVNLLLFCGAHTGRADVLRVVLLLLTAPTDWK